MTALTSKGQVTIPKRVRDHLGLTPGSEVAFSLAEDGHVVITRADHPEPMPSRIDRMMGMAGPGPTTDEVMAMIRGER